MTLSTVRSRRTFTVVPLVLVIALTVIATYGLFWMQNWFGFSDLNAIIIWSIPFWVLTWATAGIFGKVTQRFYFPIRLCFALVLGLFLGYLYTSFVFWFLGAMFFAFSIPIGLCWIVGGVAAFFGSAADGKKWGWVAIPTYLLLVIGVFALLFVPTEGFSANQDTFDSESTVDLVIYFQSDSTIEEEERFSDSVLHRPGRGNGVNLAPGVQGLWRCASPATYSAICLDMSNPQQRATLRQEAESWDVVQKVLERVVPAQVTEADLLQ